MHQLICVRIAKRFLLGKAQRAGYQMEALRVLHNQEVAQYFIDTKDIQHKAYSISYTIQNDQETRQGICIFLLKYIAYLSRRISYNRGNFNGRGWSQSYDFRYCRS